MRKNGNFGKIASFHPANRHLAGPERCHFAQKAVTLRLKQQRREIMEESIKSRYQVDHVESGLPRWLIEAAFVCLLAQAAISWSPTMTWMENHARWAIAVIQTFGSLVMYVGLLRGMKPLYRPFCVWWHLIIALNVAGFVVEFPSFIPDALRLAVAVSLFVEDLLTSLVHPVWTALVSGNIHADSHVVLRHAGVFAHILVHLPLHSVQRIDAPLFRHGQSFFCHPRIFYYFALQANSAYKVRNFCANNQIIWFSFLPWRELSPSARRISSVFHATTTGRNNLFPVRNFLFPARNRQFQA